ncbi:TPA: type II toxin-antitoxin system YhaV family toxin [Enterobacter hormaechei subsp. xiangfangensis]
MNQQLSEVAIINGWTVLAHPCFEEQLKTLIEQVEAEKVRSPESYQGKSCTKLLSVVLKVIYQGIAVAPSSNDYRQGKTLGANHKHWRRAKFGAGRHRLFFRYSAKDKIIILAWMNDEDTLRARGSKSDAYRVFERMLSSGYPPDDWDKLVAASEESRYLVGALRVVGGKK